MTWENVLAFAVGFVTATVIIVGIGFFWLKRKWKMLLFGMGAKLFGKGLEKVRKRGNPDIHSGSDFRNSADSRKSADFRGRADLRGDANFREIGRQ